jgi:hypothetical protein
MINGGYATSGDYAGRRRVYYRLFSSGERLGAARLLLHHFSRHRKLKAMRSPIGFHTLGVMGRAFCAR